MTITLPLPPRDLSPNARVHWARRARAARGYRTTAYIEACLRFRASQRQRWERATARATWYLPDARRRDQDNLAASLKAAWDGLVDAGLLADDAGLTHLPPVLLIDRARPRVEITLLEEAA